MTQLRRLMASLGAVIFLSAVGLESAAAASGSTDVTLRTEASAQVKVCVLGTCKTVGPSQDTTLDLGAILEDVGGILGVGSAPPASGSIDVTLPTETSGQVKVCVPGACQTLRPSQGITLHLDLTAAPGSVSMPTLTTDFDPAECGAGSGVKVSIDVPAGSAATVSSTITGQLADGTTIGPVPIGLTVPVGPATKTVFACAV